MAHGDRAPGTKARLVTWSVTFDPDHPGKILHCGLGYQVVLPSGRTVESSGHTWGGPDGLPPHPHRGDLQRLLDHHIGQMLAEDGLDGLV